LKEKWLLYFKYSWVKLTN